MELSSALEHADFFSPNQVPTSDVALIADHPLAQGLIGAWFPGLGLIDQTGNGNDGSFGGTVGNGVSVGGPALFTGTPGWGIIPASPALTVTTMTVAMWVVATTGNGNVRSIIQKNAATGTTNNRNFYLNALNTNVYYFGFTQGTSNFKSIIGSTTIVIGKPNFVVGTYDGANQNIYVDGKSDATAVALTGSPDSNSAWPVFFGDANNSGGAPYPGLMLFVALYNRALSAGDVEWLTAEPFDMFSPTTQRVAKGPIVTKVPGLPLLGAGMIAAGGAALLRNPRLTRRRLIGAKP